MIDRPFRTSPREPGILRDRGELRGVEQRQQAAADEVRPLLVLAGDGRDPAAGVQAVEAPGRLRPDVALLDIRMPKMAEAPQAVARAA